MFVTGNISSDDLETEGGQRAKLTLTDPAEPRRSSGAARSLRSTLRAINAKSDASGGRLREWQVAVLAQCPDIEIENVEMEIKKLVLTPILLPYELRCFFWEVFRDPLRPPHRLLHSIAQGGLQDSRPLSRPASVCVQRTRS